VKYGKAFVSQAVGEALEAKVCASEPIGGNPEAAGGAWEALVGWVLADALIG
jgi:hypothetical protein